ncbi:MAG: hypothetical protein ACR2KK_07790 [Acidimicrobiales bacterium]
MDNTSQAIRRTLAVLVVASLSAVACSSPSTTSSSPPPAPVLHSDPVGQWRAEFPSAPLREEEKMTASGLDLLIISYTTETAAESVVVGYIDYPKGVLQSKALDGAAEGSANSVKGTIQTKTATSFMGHPAMDVVIKSADAMMYERMVLRGTRLYTLIGVGATSRPASYDRLLETFFLI